MTPPREPAAELAALRNRLASKPCAHGEIETDVARATIQCRKCGAFASLRAPEAEAALAQDRAVRGDVLDDVLARFDRECEDALNIGIRPTGGEPLKAWNYVVEHFRQVLPVIIKEALAAANPTPEPARDHDDWCDGSGSSAGSACCRSAALAVPGDDVQFTGQMTWPCACGHSKSDHYFGDALDANGQMHTSCQRHDGCNRFTPANPNPELARDRDVLHELNVRRDNPYSDGLDNGERWAGWVEGFDAARDIVRNRAALAVPGDEALRMAQIEGAKALFRELIGGDSGGFIPAEQGIKDKDGKAEDWIAVGWVFTALERVIATLSVTTETTDHE